MFTLRCLVDNKSLDAARFRAEHGVAFAIETCQGQILYDTGQSGEVLVHNAAQLGLDLHKIGALILSHAHYDHTGGLEAFLQKSQPSLSLYAHPDIFRERYAIKDGQTRSIGLSMLQAELENRSKLHLSAEPSQVLPKVWTTGEITIRTEFEGRSAHHYIRADQGWQPDPYQDDLSLVLQTSQGLVVVCGCCHAGILNTLAHIRRFFPQPLRAIVGGTHLKGLGSRDIDRVVTELCERCEGSLPDLYLNHCSGESALIRFAQAFGEKVHPCPTGIKLIFE